MLYRGRYRDAEAEIYTQEVRDFAGEGLSDPYRRCNDQWSDGRTKCCHDTRGAVTIDELLGPADGPAPTVTGMERFRGRRVA